jgi:hypothetical protein
MTFGRGRRDAKRKVRSAARAAHRKRKVGKTPFGKGRARRTKSGASLVGHELAREADSAGLGGTPSATEATMKPHRGSPFGKNRARVVKASPSSGRETGMTF